MERNIILLYSLILAMFLTYNVYPQVSNVDVVINESGNFELQRNGMPYYIKGAGAKDHFDLLVQSGANSIRVWSTNNKAYLDSAHHHGLTVTLGLHVRPERSGMDYNDEYAVKGQIEYLKNEVLKYKDHPALLIWGIGNEVDLRYSNFKVWETIEIIAKFIKEVDPNHPTMTVIAGVDPSKAFYIKKYCPSIDILGLNVYGSIENAGENLRKFNWDKPYIVSEWGVNGPFEAKKTSWKAKVEPPNGLKADQRLRRYKELIEKDKEHCLGSYCFLWGQKQESTATWHGMFLSNGNPTEAVDVMQFCWTGEWPDSRAPSIRDISLQDIGWRKDHILAPLTKATLKIDIRKYNNKKVITEYILYPEAFSTKIGGDKQLSPEPIKLEIVKQNNDELTFISPKKKGAYRIFAFVKNEKGQSSVANIPFLIE
ncbi:MAG: hypothetical protein CMD15_01935 [Flavobacteriales bacterium]|nr:hypothetical protein [Flavobacteriales bacterium]|tara:strand:+ start:11369 stop:12646 length:1278 start_codon:yes stop_codon:yes gene_type:complete